MEDVTKYERSGLTVTTFMHTLRARIAAEPGMTDSYAYGYLETWLTVHLADHPDLLEQLRKSRGHLQTIIESEKEKAKKKALAA